MGLLTGLQAYYPGDDLGSKTVLDHGPRSLHLRHSNLSVSDDGMEFAVAGNNAASPVPDICEFGFLRSAFTIAMQLRMDATSGQVFGNGSITAGSRSLRMTHSGGNLLLIGTLNGTDQIIASTAFSLSTPTFVICTFDGSTLTVDTGTGSGSVAHAGPIFEPASERLFLGYVAGASSFLDGNIKDLIFWNRALTSQEQTDVRDGWRPPALAKGAIKVALNLGQSNLDGLAADEAKVGEDMRQQLSRPLVLMAGNNHSADDAFTRPRWGLRDDGLGPDLSLACELPSGWASYSFGESGTNLHTQWAKDGDTWDDAMAGWATAKAELESLGYTPEIGLYNWIQGEADSGDESHSLAYEANLTQFITDLRDELGDAPFVISRLSQAMIDNGAYAYGENTQDAQDAVEAESNTVGIVNTDDFTLETAEINHFDADSAIMLGRRLAKVGNDLILSIASSTVSLESHLGTAFRSVGSTVPIEFAWTAPDLETITGTLGDGVTALQGAISFLRTEGGRHMYQIAYNADDWPAGAGTLGYILTDGTTVRTLDLVVGEGSVSDEQIDEIATRSADAVVASADKQIVVRRRSPMHNRATNDLYLLQANDYLFVQGKHEEYETDLSGVAADYTVAVLVRGTDGNADVAFEGVGTLHDVDGSVWVRVEWTKEVLTSPGKFSWTTEVRTVAGDYVDSPIRGGMTIARNDHPPA